MRSALGPDASPVPEMRDLGEEGGHTLEQPLQEGTLASKDSVPTPQVHRKKAEGQHSARAQRQYPRLHPLLKPEGLMRALAITITICCAG